MKNNFIVGVLFLNLCDSLALELLGCPNRFESYYPKCDSIDKNIGFVYSEQKYVPICPSISDGQYPPNCNCRYGGAYDPKTNSCPNPECPANSVAKQTYPNCICIGKNNEYNAYLNECVLSCPENSTGRYPNCKCDDKMAGFNKDWFVCDICPSDSRSSSVFPNCECENSTYLTSLWGDYRNECRRCREGTSGIFPDCICDNGNTGWHAPEMYDCESCPWNSKGVFPNCNCDGSNSLVKKHKTYGYMCFDCPGDSDGVYPDCNCAPPMYYDKVRNVCQDCPPGTIRLNEFPYCKCLNANASYVPEFLECRECPINSIGKYPNCTCEEKNHLFSAFINQCYPDCFEPSKTLLEFDMTRCAERYGYSGRLCPPDSFGVSPDCKCFSDKTFVPYGWGCFETNIFAFGVQKCPDKEQKFPQCEVSIDRKVLITLIG